MNTILGRIHSVTCKSKKTASSKNSQQDVEIKFTPRCILPERTKVPQWLNDQTLSLTRTVKDLREIGEPGDSIVLTPAESSKWLTPLAVSPSIHFGSPVGQLEVTLDWWKDKKPPELEVRGPSRAMRAKLTKSGDGFRTRIKLSDLFAGYEALPAEILISCEKLKVSCTVFPADAPAAHRVLLPDCEAWTVVSPWMQLRVNAETAGAGISSLVERGRGVDHFSVPGGLIQRRFELAGHTDQLQFDGGGNKLDSLSMHCSGISRDTGTTRLCFAGTVDKDNGLQTTVFYSAYDDLPLVTIERQLFACSEKKDKKKDSDQPSEPIDDVASVAMRFRSAWRAEVGDTYGSRILSTENGKLRSIRCTQPNESVHYNTFRLFDGWTITEHPARRECMMYLFDGSRGPSMSMRLNQHALVLQPVWMYQPVHPRRGCGYTLGLAAGEVCGAADNGAWVACRTKANDGSILCSVVARIKDADDRDLAEFDLNGSVVRSRLNHLSIPGIGRLSYATACFPECDMDLPLRVAVPGIPGRYCK